MELKRRTEVVHTVDYTDLDQFVTHTLKLPFEYECVAFEEWNNDTDHHFQVKPSDGNRLFDPSMLETIAKMQAGDIMAAKYQLSDILNYLHISGHIEAGNYNIEVYW